MKKNIIKIQGFVFLVVSLIYFYSSIDGLYFFDNYLILIRDSGIFLELGYSTIDDWKYDYIFSLYRELLLGIICFFVSVVIIRDFKKGKILSRYMLIIASIIFVLNIINCYSCEIVKFKIIAINTLLISYCIIMFFVLKIKQ